jgi:hypothetical protein
MTAYPDEWYSDEEMEEARKERETWGIDDDEEWPS